MIIDEIEELAIGIRLKRLYEIFAESVVRIYKDHELDFEPKYFGLYYIISRFDEVSVTDVANELGLTHAGIIHLAHDLEKLGFIESVKSATDSRKRMLRLSARGKKVLPDFERVWSNIKQLNRKLFNSTTHNLMSAVNETEQLLRKESYYQQYNKNYQSGHMDEITITGYKPELAKYFKSLNIEWINTYFAVEEEDLRQLNNPEESVLNDGGHIVFAHYQDNVVGTCALIKSGEGEYQLAKMGVNPDFRGKKIGNKLMEAILEKAREINARKVWLGSSTKLAPALNLYKKFGFVDIPLVPSAYARADVRMELILS